MVNSKLIKLISILNKSEKSKLLSRLESMNNTSMIRKLGIYLIKNVNKPTKLEKDTISNLFFTDLSDSQISNLKFELFYFIENFTFKNWLSDNDDKSFDQNIQVQMLLLEYYKSKSLPNRFDSANNLAKLIDFKTNDIKNLIDKTDKDYMFHYFNEYRFHHFCYYGLGKEMWKNGKQYLENTLNSLDTFYCLAKLVYASEIMLRKNILNEKIQNIFLEDLHNYSLSILKTKDERKEKVALIRIYSSIIDLIKNVNENKLAALTNAVTTNMHLIKKGDLSHIITILMNFTNKISRTEDIDLTALSHQLYKLGLEKEIFTVNGLVNPLFLINYAHLCCEIQTPDNIDSVLKIYSNKIEIGFRKATQSLCEAYKYFSKKDYSKAYELVEKYSKRVTYYSIHQKILQIKCLYELNDYELLEIVRVSFQRYRLRNKKKLDTYSFEAIGNFTEMILQLSKPEVDKVKLHTLFNEHYKNSFAKNWIEQKLNEKVG